MSHANGNEMQQSLLAASHDNSQQPNYHSLQPAPQPAYPPPHAYPYPDPSHPQHPPQPQQHFYHPYSQQPQQQPLYYQQQPASAHVVNLADVPRHLQPRYRALQLPPYPKYPTLRSQFLALSRTNQAFLAILALLWPLCFIPASMRLVAAFLPLLALPSVVLYLVYRRYYAHVEINVLVRTYVIAFTVGALVVLVCETLLTLLFGVVTLYPQMDEVVAWWKAQQQQAGAAGGGGSGDDAAGSNDPFGFLSKTAGFFVFLVLVAFVVAGCVEELMKYTITSRIKRQTPGFADRTGLLLYAAAAALGFSTLENIGYAFQVRENALVVLLNVGSRVLVSSPLHVCCGYLVGIGVVRRDVYGEKLPLWRVMVLPVLLHGGFDFCLMLAASLMADDWPLLGVEIAIVLATFALIGLAIWLERRHISGPPPVLPTAMDGVAAQGGEAAGVVARSEGQAQAQAQQADVEVGAVERNDSRSYRLEHESAALV